MRGGNDGLYLSLIVITEGKGREGKDGVPHDHQRHLFGIKIPKIIIICSANQALLSHSTKLQLSSPHMIQSNPATDVRPNEAPSQANEEQEQGLRNRSHRRRTVRNKEKKKRAMPACALAHPIVPLGDDEFTYLLRRMDTAVVDGELLNSAWVWNSRPSFLHRP